MPQSATWASPIYSDLGDSSQKCIRIFILQPASNRDDEIRGQLTVVVLDDPGTDFEALSYTWGGSSEDQIIHLDGAVFAVTDNLHYALRRLRNKKAARRLWVDAICINQNDLVEKGWQVAMMGEIYSRANRVLVWIGEPEKAAQHSGESSGVLQSPFRAKYLSFNNIATPWRFARVRSLSNTICATTPHWWDRAWVVQEAVCAERITVIFGSHELGWYRFYKFLYMVHDDILFKHEADEEFMRQVLRAVEGIQGIRKRYWKEKKDEKKPKTPLSWIIWRARQAQATQARDKVYSLLAMMPREIAAFLNPEYSEDIADTFAKATYYVIRADADLNILVWVPLRSRPNNTEEEGERGGEMMVWKNPDLPGSWAVDFADLKYGLFHAAANGQENFWRESSTRVEYLTYTSGRTLELEGYVLDTIRRCIDLPYGQSWGGAVDDEGVLYDFLAEALSLSRENNVRALFEVPERRSAEAKGESEGFIGSSDWVKDEVHKRWKKRRIRCPVDQLSDGLDLWDEVVGFKHGHKSQDAWHHNLAVYSVRVASNAKIFSTTMGFVGVAPGVVENGDIVTLLDGARLPITLSPKDQDDSQFTFRGYAGVHGAMESLYSYSSKFTTRTFTVEEQVRRRQRFQIC
ncbi:heterokaryon incompatibility protein-domain-containing protein [Xylaria curta]|nr:heterokaryon incompatibility protein-domain-containing protein [Xylaria curta]